jgi:[ribosomal protein S5]-alanine N-acetyltransferase
VSTNSHRKTTLSQFTPLEHLPKALESKHLIIRKYHMRDAEEFSILHDEALRHHLAPWSPEFDLERTAAESLRGAREFILTVLEKWEDQTDFRFVIEEKSSGRIVGQVGITGIIRNVNHAGFIGYWIGKDYLNKGYATEAVVTVLTFAFEFLKLHRMHLWISPDNAPSLRIAQKLELRHEGTVLRALYLGGRWQDTHSFAITSEEWEERGKSLMERFGVKI